jgi:Acetyltransferase (GNAT) domain
MKEIILSNNHLQTPLRSTLCCSSGDAMEESILYCKKFIAPSSAISVRRFCIPADLPLINDWINREYGAGHTHLHEIWPELLQIYSDIQQSNCAQSFMVLHEMIPVCLADIYKASQDAISLIHPVMEGDYILYLLTDPKEKEARYLYKGIVQTTLEYFFTFTEVKRVITELDKNSTECKQALQAGFRLLQKNDPARHRSSLYYSTRETLETTL